MKKLFAILLCLVMVFSFAACGGGNDNGTAPRTGCLLPLILLAVLACVVLQLTGTVDFVGWIENLFNIG